MALSPRKLASNFTNFTANRGVEANEEEIANTYLEAESGAALQSSTSGGVGCSCDREECRAAGDCCSPPTADTVHNSTDSYLQVLVHKQRRHRPGLGAAARQKSRLPEASSPEQRSLRAPQVREELVGNAGTGQTCSAGQALLFTCPFTAALHQRSWAEFQRSILNSIRDKDADLLKSSAPAENNRGEVTRQQSEQKETAAMKSKNNIRWKSMGDILRRGQRPERVEIYYFEDNVEMLSSRSGGAETSVERATASFRSAAARILAEVLAVPRLLIMIPIHLVLSLEKACRTRR
ncbi:unnamed protein product [Leptidea sinapis]|uniref:Uncharacterized protein n=1 Tax=Leptidea sinapis TaxID=189913 RepID=A0A5E4R6D1_9NEOP|nr:unnamed protein product [Leptidea sinapis]